MIYSISDLHLSLSTNKPMNVFGENWEDHHLKIKEHWLSLVKEDDVVLIPGDVSWALKLEEALEDLRFLEELPGTKIFVKGNHDLWWSSLKKINAIGFKKMIFLQNNSFSHQGISYCGTRGWSIPEDGVLAPEDQKIYARELGRLELSLKEASEKKIIALLHFPPFSRKGEPSEFVALLKRYGVEFCVYGHIHNQFDHREFLDGTHEGIAFRLVSCDYLQFELINIKV